MNNNNTNTNKLPFENNDVFNENDVYANLHASEWLVNARYNDSKKVNRASNMNTIIWIIIMIIAMIIISNLIVRLVLLALIILVIYAYKKKKNRIALESQNLRVIEMDKLLNNNNAQAYIDIVNNNPNVSREISRFCHHIVNIIYDNHNDGMRRWYYIHVYTDNPDDYAINSKRIDMSKLSDSLYQYHDVDNWSMAILEIRNDEARLLVPDNESIITSILYAASDDYSMIENHDMRLHYEVNDNVRIMNDDNMSMMTKRINNK